MIFALLTWSLARGYFPAQSPHLAGLTAWLAAVATSLAFFASILVPVVSDGRLLGMLGREGILHYIATRAELGV